MPFQPSALKFPLLPRRSRTSKKDFGHVMVAAGSRHMMGAAQLCAEAALVAGSGLVTVLWPKALERASLRLPAEIMRLLVSRNPQGQYTQIAAKALISYAEKRNVNVIALGPGLSTGLATKKLVKYILENAKCPMVLDADGLNNLKGEPESLLLAKKGLVITPHEGEFARIFGMKPPANVKRRLMLAKKLSRIYHVVLVLKGAPTLIVSGDRYCVRQTGNPGMAKGGSGDALTGVIAAFLAQGLAPFEAAAWAAHCHGLAADIAVQETSELSLTASKIIEFLPKAFGRLKTR